jgi:hypothetical protein
MNQGLFNLSSFYLAEQRIKLSLTETPQCQHSKTHRAPPGQEQCTAPSQRVPSGQIPTTSQLSQGPPLPRVLEGDKLVPNFPEPKTHLHQERSFVQRPKATVSQGLIVLSSPETCKPPTKEPGYYRPGSQRLVYPEKSHIHQSILASKGRLSHRAPHKSGRFFPVGTEPADLTRAFATNPDGSKLIEIHQLFSDLSLQVTRASESGYHISVQRLASPQD